MNQLAQPRWIQWLHAIIFGYFWLPCPICGEEFGGHESNNNHPGVFKSRWGGDSISICPKKSCQIEADKINAERMKTYGSFTVVARQEQQTLILKRGRRDEKLLL